MNRLNQWLFRITPSKLVSQGKHTCSSFLLSSFPFFAPFRSVSQRGRSSSGWERKQGSTIKDLRSTLWQFTAPTLSLFNYLINYHSVLFLDHWQAHISAMFPPGGQYPEPQLQMHNVLKKKKDIIKTLKGLLTQLLFRNTAVFKSCEMVGYLVQPRANVIKTAMPPNLTADCLQTLRPHEYILVSQPHPRP